MLNHILVLIDVFGYRRRPLELAVNRGNRQPRWFCAVPTGEPIPPVVPFAEKVKLNLEGFSVNNIGARPSNARSYQNKLTPNSESYA